MDKNNRSKNRPKDVYTGDNQVVCNDETGTMGDEDNNLNAAVEKLSFVSDNTEVHAENEKDAVGNTHQEAPDKKESVAKHDNNSDVDDKLDDTEEQQPLDESH